MQGAFHGHVEDVKDALKAQGLEYAVSIGRRAPMHRIHADCLLEIAEAGLKPVIFIGSTNGADSRWFDAVKNPLTPEQQKEQLKHALPQIYDDALILTLPDVGNQEKWFDGFFEMFDGTPFKDKSVVHYRAKAADAKDANGAIKPLSAYMEGFGKRGLPAWESYNRAPADDEINATEIRSFDLNNLTDAQRALMAAPDYVISLARDARAANPDRDILKDVPLTVFDLTLERLRREAGIATAQVLSAAASHDLKDLQQAAGALTKARFAEKEQAMTNTIALKIASASTNQTGGDWSRNLENIIKAIDKAVEDKADLLALEELGLTGYERGDDFQYSDNAKTRELLQIIADYAASKNPNLIISVGHPWYFADKDLPEQEDRRKNPLYNRVNKQYDAQSFIAGGEVVAISAKSYLFNYERGYETRHFEEWSDAFANQYENKFGKGRDGTIFIELPGMTYPDGTEVPPKAIPFGSPVIQAGTDERFINLWHIICEMYWIGSRYDGSPNNDDYARDNPLPQKARDFDITVAVNPNASPPVANKIDKHYELSKLASQYAGVLVHTDGLGSSGSTFAQFGSRLMAQNGELISEGTRGTFADMAYTSQVVHVKPAVSKGHAPHGKIAHKFATDHSAPVQDGPAPWEHGPRREMEEELRNELLWLYDYMRKNKIQGVTQALSGGMDSAYNAAKVRMMVDLGVQELGFEGFMDSMKHLSYRHAALAAYQNGGVEAGIDAVMDHMLTSVYMGTDNSSQNTLNAAKTLVEGGMRKDGTTFKGIGGKFEYRNVQRLVEVYAEIYSGVNPGKISDERDAEIRKELATILRTRKEDTTPEELERRIHVLKSTFEEVAGDVLSTANDKHSVAYENIQARLRQVLIMLFSNVENKIAIANPNLDEGRNSYATWGGDLHGGMISGNAHKDKQRQIDHMKLLHQFGLQDSVAPVEAFYWVLENRPSAELQPLSKDGKVTQFDEDQLGRSFRQMDMISHYMLNDRPLAQGERKNNPIEVFEKTKLHPFFDGDSIEVLHDRIRLSYEKWQHAQFKIHGSPIAATYGKSIDHQSSLRTPNISAFHRPELAQLAIYALDQLAQRDGIPFEQLSGGTSAKALIQRALIDDEFAAALGNKMWTLDATDGRKMKLGSLYDYARKNTLAPIATPSKMSQIFDAAAQYRRKAANTGQPAAKKQARPGM
ncbi:MAG TPA: nitrilase-related carbon-nitrogen hydrolase [Patescibacteria group bacterium]|nr:nitrilase-related carbon-nitrogen hydrolase [Patescibacteria group bacterium]